MTKFSIISLTLIYCMILNITNGVVDVMVHTHTDEEGVCGTPYGGITIDKCYKDPMTGCYLKLICNCDNKQEGMTLIEYASTDTTCSKDSTKQTHHIANDKCTLYHNNVDCNGNSLDVSQVMLAKSQWVANCDPLLCD
mmetsp:Transcript_50955/g.45765  ORF Transcript_50955/g.45765 Transcript_50955/m.45765 type:complete len:138 (+) Transcript_50955:111-524(+)